MPIKSSISHILSLILFVTAQLAFSAPGDPGNVLSTLTINNLSGDGRTPTTPQGITMHDGYLWIVDFGTDRIYRVYPEDIYDDMGTSDTADDVLLFSAGDSDLNLPLTDTDNPPINSDGTPIATCGATPAGQYCGGGGLTFAENYLWNASPITDDIIKVDPVDGDNLESENALASLAFPSPTDMTYDGHSFWIVDWQTNTINKVRPEDGALLLSLPGPSTLPSYQSNPSVTNARPFGITWDGRDLWVADQEELKVYRIDPSNGDVLDFFATPGADPKGLSWNGEYLWHTDQTTGTIYAIETGVIPFGITGCLEKNGVAINADVLLSQTAEIDQSVSTDIDGCFQFTNFTAGTPLQIKASEAGVDEKPIITLAETSSGSTDVTLIVGDVYSEPGYTAIDTEDGDITTNVVARPNVIDTPTIIDTSTPNPAGVVVEYDVVDSAGNNADTVSRIVYVLEADIIPPVITLVGNDPTYVEQLSTYDEPGATAIDNRDGDISANITVTGTVDPDIAGTYTLSYDVSDAVGNAATTVTRDVIVQDTTIPVITLNGDASMTIERGDPYTEPGATATDNVDGPIDASIVISGSVTTDTVGSYIVNYNVADSSGNDAVVVSRTINVVDTTPPVITLLGDSPLNHELNAPFSDPGATALDVPGEDLSGSINVTGSVDETVAGTYILSYDVTDTAGNIATTITRDVVVADTGAPTINLVGDNLINHEQGTPYTEPGYSATDAIDDDTTLTAAIVIGGDTVNPNVAGTYNVTYDVTDSAGNPAPQVVRTIVVADTTPPIITLTGDANVNHELQTVYNDAGATASDNIDVTVTVTTTGTVDSNTTGIYQLTYNATDSSGNAAAPLTRVIDVADRTAPIITLLGNNPLDHEVGTIFNDPGASATDIIDDDAAVTAAIGVTGSVDANTVGSYTLNYNVSDSAGNAATTVTRTVNVLDTGSPTITLLGANPVLHEIQNAYNDAGATASDAADGDLGPVTGVGTVDINVAGTYTLTYNINDSQGNPAPTVTRDVIVADRTPPVITLTGADSINHEQGTTYTDAGATATDIFDGPLGAATPTGAVNVNAAGTYILSYDISDAAGNAATTVTRTVIVADRTAPVITLVGANPLNHEVDTVFVDPGASATDAIDDNATLTAAIGVTGSVNASTLGAYVLSYNVTDSSGNSATTVNRTVNVVDTGAPTITLLGNNPVLHEQNTPYTDAGATASDAADGNLGSVPAVGTVNVNAAGTYTLTYNINDSQGNPAPTVTRDVIVADRTAPLITITGSTTINHEQGTVYSDAGATGSDNIDPSVTVNTTSTVNSSVPGTYTVTYNATDTAGNSATPVVRTVIVSDTTIPVITLLGDNPVNHEVDTIFVDPGANASDNIDGPIPGGNITVSGIVDASTIGTYDLTYNVTDSAGNAATPVIRTVNVADTGAPVITILGDNPLNHEVGTTYVDPGATASDAVDGPLTPTAVSTVNDAVTGTYTVTYDVMDSNSNPAAQKVRTVNVGDFTPPVITITGSTTVNVEQGTSYTELGATATDNVDGVIDGSVITSGSVDPLIAGTYLVTYNVTDAAGNNATEAVRTVIVADTTLPVITLSGASTIDHEQGTVYSDPGAGATDNIDGNLNGSVTVSGFVDANVAGTYILSYNVSDAAGNNATTVTRTVNVADTTIPVITITGDNPLNHEQATVYTDPGATASDNIDGTITGNINAVNTVNSSVAGNYTVTYDVNDAAGNAASTVIRDVIVADTIAPVITLNGNITVNHEQGTTYTDAGATASDAVDLSLTVNVTGSVDDTIAGTYLLNYDVSDTAGNPATTVTRTVIVEDTIPPSITLIGDSVINHPQGSTFNDPGYTANDNIDGVITDSVNVTGSVVVTVPGTYTLTYNVNDAAGNPAPTVTRDVIIADTTPPVITLTGSGTIILEQDLGGTYNDAGATANDDVDGNITARIAVSGDTVDPTAAGVYVIRYDVSDDAGNAALQVTRTVTVRDTIAPIITLNGSTPINHVQGTTYNDAGATAFDAADGDVTAGITPSGSVDTATIGTYFINYDVNDTANNAATTATRTVNVTDGIAPVITLNGDAVMDHVNGQIFNDPGANATDNHDPSLGPVNVSGTIDINTDGAYVLSYDISDAAGNAATTVTRTINVVTPAPIFIEAETATIGGNSVVENNDTGHSGSYVNIDLATGVSDYLEFTGIMAFGIPYNLTIRYASTDDNTPMEVILNSVSIDSIALPATSSNTLYVDSATLSITPVSGANTLRFNIPLAPTEKRIDSFTLTPQ